MTDGGDLYPFGDAPYLGSSGNFHLNVPIVAMAPTPDGKGYWLLDDNGNVFPYGDASTYPYAGG